MFIILGVLWVILAMFIQILSRLAFGIEQDMYKPFWVFIIIQAVALVIINSIYLAVVINHATQCELIIFYVNEIRTRLEEKSITLKDAMQVNAINIVWKIWFEYFCNWNVLKQILDIRLAIGSLNSTVSKMTSLVALTFLEKVIIGKKKKNFFFKQFQ